MITANIAGGLQGVTSTVLSGTSIADVFTASSDKVTCAGFCIVNNTSSAIDVEIYRYIDPTDTLFWKKSIPADDTVIETDIPLKLRNAQKIKAKGDTGITVTPIILSLG